MSSHTLTLGPRTYPVVLPNIRDSRLHVAAVIVTIHVLGQTSLRFHISVPQILAAIGTCAIIEVAMTFRSSRAVVWPASAMLTGSGVALILRVPSTPPGDHWSTHAWYVFAGVAALSLLTKYLIRFRGSHVFNPSNVGLVVAFIVLGSTRIEPLDFWWGPLDRWMFVAYAVILVGGVLITRRLQLLAAAATFWITLAAGVGVLAASGHCMIARWAFAPVCGFDYWRVIVTSPEVLIFLFFMITDPKTVPAGRNGRIVFAAAVGDHQHAPDGAADQRVRDEGRPARRSGGRVRLSSARGPTRPGVPIGPRACVRRWSSSPAGVLVPLGALLVAVVVVAGAIVAAGSPPAARSSRRPPTSSDGTHSTSTPPRSPRSPSSRTSWTGTTRSPGREHRRSSSRWSRTCSSRARRCGVPMPRRWRRSITATASTRCAIASRAAAGGPTVVDSYRIDDVNVTLVVPFGKQVGLSLGLETRGTVTTETLGPDGDVESRTSSPFATTFVMSRPTGGRWLNVAERPVDADT